MKRIKISIKTLFFLIILFFHKEAWVGGSYEGSAVTNDGLFVVVYGSRISVDYADDSTTISYIKDPKNPDNLILDTSPRKPIDRYKEETVPNNLQAEKILKKIAPLIERLKKRYVKDLIKPKDAGFHLGRLDQDRIDQYESLNRSEKKIVGCNVEFPPDPEITSLVLAFSKIPPLPELKKLNEEIVLELKKADPE